MFVEIRYKTSPVAVAKGLNISQRGRVRGASLLIAH